MMYIVHDNDKIIQASNVRPSEYIIKRMGWDTILEVDRGLFHETDPIGDYHIQNGELTKKVNNRVEQVDARMSLTGTDFKVTRHLEQKEQGIETSLTDAEYAALLAQRQEWRDLID